MKKTIGFITFLLFTGLSLSTGKTFASEHIVIPVSTEIDISVEQFPAQGKYLVVWLAPEYGLRAAHRSFAQMLTDQNIEVWMSNIVESLFMPQGSSSIKKLDGKYVADIIEYAHKNTGKKIIVAGDSYGALSALLGAHQWQTRKQTSPYLIGAILFTPYTYVSIPPLGQLPEYMPVISATNIPIMIYQAKNSGNISQFDSLVKQLQQHGNPVYTRLTPKVMSLFYEDKVDAKMQALVKPLSINLSKMIPLLEKHRVPLQAITLPTKQTNYSVKRGIDTYLKEYQGQVKPVAIRLEDTFNKLVIKNNYQGKVTVINFWATWCTPCVQEIPSLNRLKKKMKGLAFELISINYAEDKETIASFMKMVNVEFPVLLDLNGDFASQWNVIAYPSTFVIDKTGKIKYGVNAAIEWDEPEVVEKLKALL